MSAPPCFQRPKQPVTFSDLEGFEDHLQQLQDAIDSIDLDGDHDHHGGRSRMSRFVRWTWICFTVILSLVLVVSLGTGPLQDFATYYVLFHDPWKAGIDDFFVHKGSHHPCAVDQRTCVGFTALLLSTGLGGLAAIWLWLVAPTAHILLASRFLMLNWSMALLSVMIISLAYSERVLWIEHVPGIVCTALKGLLVMVELPFLQFFVQHRMKSIWPALQQRRCEQVLKRSYFVEVCFLCLVALCSVWHILAFYVVSGAFEEWHQMESANVLSIFVAAIGVLVSFLIWVLSVAVLLCRACFMFHRALLVSQVGGLTNALKALQSCRRVGLLQVAGLFTSATTSSGSAFVAVHSLLTHTSEVNDFHALMVIQSINTVINAASVIYLSGAFPLLTQEASPPPLPFLRWKLRSCSCWKRKELGHGSKRRSYKGDAWDTKTEELAGRGISLAELLFFYRKLGDSIMMSYQPSIHTTNDVVRLGIIPLTSSTCSSYAELINKGVAVIPERMITHNWSNLFRDLVAGIVAHSLGEHTFQFIADLLSEEAGVKAVETMLEVQGSLSETYWICAFAVNQHLGICGANPRGDVDPVTMVQHPVCTCKQKKFFNETPPLSLNGQSINCEMNKFDDMMAWLAASNPSFAQVVCVDASFQLFHRAWCVAEIAEAHRRGMEQSLNICNREVLIREQHALKALQVEKMKASRPEDVDGILAKIPDIKAFNETLQELIFNEKFGLLSAWKKVDALQEMEELSHMLKWVRLSETVEDCKVVWKRWPTLNSLNHQVTRSALDSDLTQMCENLKRFSAASAVSLTILKSPTLHDRHRLRHFHPGSEQPLQREGLGPKSCHLVVFVYHLFTNF